MTERLPDFLGIGTQKGGTTSLQALLEQHPGVYMPTSKELHYFSLHYNKDRIWYSSQFEAANPEQLCGEITPYYLFHPEVPQRIVNLIPQARLIILLRDPVERALSQYFHARRHGFEILNLADALAAEVDRLRGSETCLSHPGGRHNSHQKHSYVSRSRYEEQLDRYTAIFPADQLLVMRSEDLFIRTDAWWHKIQHFLNLDPIALPGPVPRANAGRGEAAEVPETIRKALRDRLQPTVVAMRTRYGIAWDWD
jgi:hypothetical protein